jgi:hypothetical protein
VQKPEFAVKNIFDFGFHRASSLAGRGESRPVGETSMAAEKSLKQQ